MSVFSSVKSIVWLMNESLSEECGWCSFSNNGSREHSVLGLQKHEIKIC